MQTATCRTMACDGIGRYRSATPRVHSRGQEERWERLRGSDRGGEAAIEPEDVRPEFEVYCRERVTAPAADVSLVTIDKQGAIILNAAAFVALSYAKAVELLYDPAKQVIGMRTVPMTQAGAF